VVPDEVLNRFRQAVDKGTTAETDWNKLFNEYQAKYPAEAALFEH